MAASTAGTVMAKRNDLSVKIDAEVVRNAKIVAASKDITLAEYLSEILRPLVQADLRQWVKSQNFGDEPKPKGPPRPGKN